MPPPPTWWRCPRTRRRTPRASTPPCTSSTPPAARRSGSSGYPTAPSGPASATGCGAPLRRGDGDTTAREQSLFRDHPKDVILRPVTLQHSTARYFTGRRIYSPPSDPSFRSTTLHPDLVSPVADGLALAADAAEHLALGVGLGAGGAGEDALGLALAELRRGRRLGRRGGLRRRLRGLLAAPSPALVLLVRAATSAALRRLVVPEALRQHQGPLCGRVPRAGA